MTPENAPRLAARRDIDGFLVGGASLDPARFLAIISLFRRAVSGASEVSTVIYVLYTLHIILCLFLILVVLLQQGKGADLSVFGGGTTMTAFGARSATTLLHRLTVGGFVGFVLTTLLIAYLQGQRRGRLGDARRRRRPAASAPAGAPAPAPAAPASARDRPRAPRAPTTPPPPQLTATRHGEPTESRMHSMPKWRNW